MIFQEKNAITISNLHFSREGTHIIDNLSLSIGPGEKILIKGRNGSGKTTLIKLILGLIQPDRG
ncbi:MAG: ATP-binding cassette domain-containing protein, partial [Proteobacteria bacterium]|nr:ATP-binding cassette domain-containing protein [Pseudomonadota bacterium]